MAIKNYPLYIASVYCKKKIIKTSQVAYDEMLWWIDYIRYILGVVNAKQTATNLSWILTLLTVNNKKKILKQNVSISYIHGIKDIVLIFIF